MDPDQEALVRAIDAGDIQAIESSSARATAAVIARAYLSPLHREILPIVRQLTWGWSGRDQQELLRLVYEATLGQTTFPDLPPAFVRAAASGFTNATVAYARLIGTPDALQLAWEKERPAIDAALRGEQTGHILTLVSAGVRPSVTQLVQILVRFHGDFRTGQLFTIIRPPLDKAEEDAFLMEAGKTLVRYADPGQMPPVLRSAAEALGRQPEAVLWTVRQALGPQPIDELRWYVHTHDAERAWEVLRQHRDLEIPEEMVIMAALDRRGPRLIETLRRAGRFDYDGYLVTLLHTALSQQVPELRGAFPTRAHALLDEVAAQLPAFDAFLRALDMPRAVAFMILRGRDQPGAQLRDAITRQDEVSLRWVLEEDPIPITVDLISRAADYGHTRILELLIEHDAELRTPALEADVLRAVSAQVINTGDAYDRALRYLMHAFDRTTPQRLIELHGTDPTPVVRHVPGVAYTSGRARVPIGSIPAFGNRRIGVRDPARFTERTTIYTPQHVRHGPGRFVMDIEPGPATNVYLPVIRYGESAAHGYYHRHNPVHDAQFTWFYIEPESGVYLHAPRALVAKNKVCALIMLLRRATATPHPRGVSQARAETLRELLEETRRDVADAVPGMQELLRRGILDEFLLDRTQRFAEPTDRYDNYFCDVDNEPPDFTHDHLDEHLTEVARLLGIDVVVMTHQGGANKRLVSECVDARPRRISYGHLFQLRGVRQ